MEDKKIELIDFAEIIKISSEYLRDIGNKEKKEAFDDLKSKIIVKHYMPLNQKKILLELILIDIKAMDTESSSFSIGLELSKCFHGLMAYTNIDMDMSPVMRTEAFYDIFQISGLYDYILSYCSKDYATLEGMVRDMISFDNIKILTETLSALDTKSIDDLNEEFRKFRLGEDAELIKDLADIVRANDPILQEVQKSIQDGAYEVIQKIENKN